MAAITYSRSVNDLWDLDTYKTKDELLKAIKNIPYMRGGTNTGKALHYVSTKKLLASAGRRPAGVVPALTVVITDGESNDDAASAAIDLQSKSIVISIGIKVKSLLPGVSTLA